MKTEKIGDATGRRSWGSSFSGDPGAKFSGGKRGPGAKQGEDPLYEEDSARSFYFCISSLAEPLCSGPQRSRARRFSGAAERTLDGEDRCERIGEGGKTWFSRTQDLCKTTEDQG